VLEINLDDHKAACLKEPRLTIHVGFLLWRLISPSLVEGERGLLASFLEANLFYIVRACSECIKIQAVWARANDRPL
jgi:hypothetical protein